MVGGRPVGAVPVQQPRDFRDARRLSRRARAAARRCRSPPIATRRSISPPRRRRSEAVAITARANAGSQWWRKGHSHLDESEIWIVNGATLPAATPTYTQITNGGAKDAWPMWAAGGKGLYFMSDRSGAQNIWAMSAVVGRVRVRHRAGAAQADHVPSRTAACCGRRSRRTARRSRSSATSAIWTVDTASGQAHEVPIALRGAPAAAGVEHRTFSDQLQELALSPDGKKAAFTVHGEIFSVSAKDGGDAVRVHDDGRRRRRDRRGRPTAGELVYMLGPRRPNQLFIYDFGTGKETQLTAGARRDDMPRFSPDGKWIAFERDSTELRVIDPATKAEKLLATGIFDTPPFADARDVAWSPDSRFIAYFTAGTKAFQNVHVVPAAGGEARAGQLPRELQRRIAVVEPRRHLPDLRHVAADRAGRRRCGSICCRVRRSSAKISSAICSARSSRRRRAADAGVSAPAAPAPPTPPAQRGREASRGDRLRRDQTPRDRAARRHRRRAPGDQPRRQVAPADRQRRRSAEPVRVPDRRAVEGAGGRAAADVDARRASAARTSPPTARRSTTWIAAACST